MSTSFITWPTGFPYNDECTRQGISYWWGLDGILTTPSANIGASGTMLLTGTVEVATPAEASVAGVYGTLGTRDKTYLDMLFGSASTRLSANVTTQAAPFSIGLWFTPHNLIGQQQALFTTDPNTTISHIGGVTVDINATGCVNVYFGTGHAQGYYPSAYLFQSAGSLILVEVRTFVVLTCTPVVPIGLTGPYCTFALYINGAPITMNVFSSAMVGEGGGDSLYFPTVNIVYGQNVLGTTTRSNELMAIDSPFFHNAILSAADVQALWVAGT